MYGQRELSAARVAQAIMAVIGKVALVADGLWGTTTQRAYDSLSTDVKALVDKTLQSLGTNAAELGARYTKAKRDGDTSISAGKAARGKLLANRDEMIALTKKVSAEEGVPETTALVITRLESNFDPNAVSPTGFKGLTQLGTPAMTDVYNFKNAGVDWKPAGRNKYGPLYAMVNPFNPEQNLRVGCRYMRICARQLKVPLTDIATVYMGFNIGYGGAKLVLAGRAEEVRNEIMANPAYAKNGVHKYRETLASVVNSTRVV